MGTHFLMSIFFRWSWSKPPSTQWPFFGPKTDLHLFETHTTQKSNIHRYQNMSILSYFNRDRIVFQSHHFFRGTFIRSFFAGHQQKNPPVASNQMGWNKPPSISGPKKRPPSLPSPITSPVVSTNQERFPKGSFNRMNNDSSGFSRPMGPWDQLVPAWKCWDERWSDQWVIPPKLLK